MTVKDCSRCHGHKFNNKTGRYDKGEPEPTMRVENVMGSTKTIHWHCSNCCHRETSSYDEVENDKQEERTEIKTKVDVQAKLL